MQTTAEMKREIFAEIKTKIMQGFVVALNMLDPEDILSAARRFAGVTPDADGENVVNSLLALTQLPSNSERLAALSREDRDLLDYCVAAMPD